MTRVNDVKKHSIQLKSSTMHLVRSSRGLISSRAITVRCSIALYKAGLLCITDRPGEIGFLTAANRLSSHSVLCAYAQCVGEQRWERGVVIAKSFILLLRTGGRKYVFHLIACARFLPLPCPKLPEWSKRSGRAKERKG